MKKADPHQQARYDDERSRLYKRYNTLKEDLFAEHKNWSKVFSSPALQDAELEYLALRNSCPQCGSVNTEVRNFDQVWRDADVVCRDCDTYVRDYDAG